MASDRNSSRDERYQTKTQPDTNSNLFLKIIDEGVNNIILDLKNALDGKKDNGLVEGTTQATNNAAKKVFDALESLSGNIRSDLGYADGISNEEIGRKLDTNWDNVLEINEGESESSINTIPHPKYVDDYVDEDENNELVANTEITLIENRLKKCVNLEDLYLKKHDEILNIFRFVLNLFDKYKYAIKVILYLLKNLVRPEDISTTRRSSSSNNGSDTRPLGIKLPIPLIKNINLLLDDQDKIQNVITHMKPIIDDNNFMTTEEENLYTAPGNIENTENPASATATATAPAH